MEHRLGDLHGPSHILVRDLRGARVEVLGGMTHTSKPVEGGFGETRNPPFELIGDGILDRDVRALSRSCTETETASRHSAAILYASGAAAKAPSR